MKEVDIFNYLRGVMITIDPIKVAFMQTGVDEYDYIIELLLKKLDKIDSQCECEKILTDIFVKALSENIIDGEAREKIAIIAEDVYSRFIYHKQKKK